MDIDCEPEVYAVRKVNLGISEVFGILQDPSVNPVVSNPPKRPKAGEVYIFKANSKAKQGI